MTTPAQKVHKLKIWPWHYDNVASGKKTFELRENDRDYREGDILQLESYDPAKKAYDGRTSAYRVTYVHSFVIGKIPSVIMSIARADANVGVCSEVMKEKELLEASINQAYGKYGGARRGYPEYAKAHYSEDGCRDEMTTVQSYAKAALHAMDTDVDANMSKIAKNAAYGKFGDQSDIITKRIEFERLCVLRGGYQLNRDMRDAKAYVSTETQRAWMRFQETGTW